MGKIRDLIYRRGSELIKNIFSVITNGKRTFERIGKAISETIKKKDGFSGLMNRLRDVFRKAVSDAKRTTQTETTRAENQARQDAGEKYQEETGETVYKTWICTFHNSRDSHIALHGTTIPLDEDFHAFGGPMAYPGDSSRVGPEEICNCRCYMIVEEE